MLLSLLPYRFVTDIIERVMGGGVKALAALIRKTLRRKSGKLQVKISTATACT